MDPRDILVDATIEGCKLTLPAQLYRRDYVAVNRVLEVMGGRWDRRAGGHMFADDPTDAIRSYVRGGDAPRPARTTDGFVPTRAGIADMIAAYPYANVSALEPGATVLEPSAGNGALVRGIRRVRAWSGDTTVRIVAVEPNPQRASCIGDVRGRDTVVVDTFESYAASTTLQFDAVVMNPPFAVPGQPSIWIDHVRLALGLLTPGGRLVAIVPASYAYRQDRKHRELRYEVEPYGDADDLPRDAFPNKMATMVLTVDRPLLNDWPFDLRGSLHTHLPTSAVRPSHAAVSSCQNSGSYRQSSLLDLLEA